MPYWKLIFLGIMSFFIAGCQYFLFKPYDYQHSKDAEIKKKKSDYSVGIKGKKLYLRKTFSVPKPPPPPVEEKE
jgi:hypothetical protein